MDEQSVAGAVEDECDSDVVAGGGGGRAAVGANVNWRGDGGNDRWPRTATHSAASASTREIREHMIEGK